MGEVGGRPGRAEGSLGRLKVVASVKLEGARGGVCEVPRRCLIGC